MKLGKNMVHALEFVTRNAGWQTFNTNCKVTTNAINRLAARGLVEISGDQFRLKEIEKPFYERPVASKGLISYRYRLDHGWIMIGAKSNADALNEAGRSISKNEVVNYKRLEIWNGEKYVEVEIKA